jgi:hypothetical protein
MSSIYPGAIDGYAQLPLVVDTVTQINADTVNRLRSAIVNLETELGIEPSGTYDDVRARLDALETILTGLVGDEFDFTDFLNRLGDVETKVEQMLAITVVNTDTLLDETYGTVLVNASSGTVAITLPAIADGFTKIYNIKKVDSSSNLVVITPQTGETIDGEDYFEINYQYDSYSIINHSTGWFNI